MNRERQVVVITGSSGLIGAAAASRLDRVYNVIGFDRPGEPHPPAHIECIDLNVTSDDSVHQGMREVRERYGNRIASVIHLAAYYDFKGEASDKYDEITVHGTRRLLQALKEFAVEQFIFSSTMLVHAPCDLGQKIDENWPINPTWPYPESKVRTEKLVQAERGNIPVVMLRIAGVYNDMCHSIPIANQIQRIYERQLTSHFYPASLNRGQAFVHLDDLVDAFALLVERRTELPPETALLIGEPDTVPYGELQSTLGKLIHGKAWATYHVPKPAAKLGAWLQEHLPFGGEAFIKPWMIDRAGDHYELDITRARTLLGWEPKQSLRRTLPVMIDYLKRDPAAWYRENNLEAPKTMPQLAGVAYER